MSFVFTTQAGVNATYRPCSRWRVFRENTHSDPLAFQGIDAIQD